MNGKIFITPLRGLALALTALAVLAIPSFSATINLVAEEATLATDGTLMWGYFEDTGQLCNPTTPPAWGIGPQINVGPADTTLTINLRNCLDSAATSVVISGQNLPLGALGAPLAPTTITDGQSRVRVTSFTQPAAAGGTMTYTWNNLKDGTYLYQSGTNPALQQPMGLYGAVKVEQTAGQAYGVDYQQEQVLLYSEIDPAQHAPPVSPKPLDYKPKHFLINGQPVTAGTLPAGSVNSILLLRMLNAGLKTHIPTLLNGYLRVIAEDGYGYTYPKDQYSVMLPAGKTMDALFTPMAAGNYPLFDRSLNLTSAGATGGGMLTTLAVSSGAGPMAVDDAYSVDEDGVLIVDGTVLPGILANDTGTGPLTANLVTNVGNGALALNPVDGTFTYTPNPNFSGADFFTYKANDGTFDSNLAMVRITVNPTNDSPVANNDGYSAVAGTTLLVAAPGVLGNDSDLDGNLLTAVLDAAPAAGILNLNADGSFSYTANAGTTSDSFSYFANDGSINSPAATVTITVIPPVNTAPVAVDDAATTAQNTPVTILLLANDYDAEGPLNPASVEITAPPNRGGTAQNLLNGTVIYTPKRGFKGTDIFTYTVRDSAGLVSNQATVRVNVVK